MENAKTVLVDEAVINDGKIPEITFSNGDSEQIAIDA